ncbi:MAG: DUF1838 family protein [Pseudomonadota bacterium]|nr:DUF1838 family protein [Pseudomonadota bacterium]
MANKKNSNQAPRNGIGPALEGPYLDLRTGRGNQLAYARIQGNLDFGQQKYYWFKGSVMALRPGHQTQDILGIQGFGVIRLNQRKDGVIERMCSQLGLFTDLRSGEVLEEWDNPFTNEKVNVVHVAMTPVNYTIEEFFPPPPGYDESSQGPMPKIPFILPWYQHGEWIEMQFNLHMSYPNPLQPNNWPRESAGEMVQASEMFTHHIKAEDLQNPALTTLDYQGSWGRHTPWMPWMLMGQTPGQCSYNAFMGSCNHPGEVLSRLVIDYAEKNYSSYFDAPKVMEGRGPSDLELYAIEQQPASN